MGRGEKNSKYFFSLEKARYIAKTTTALFDRNGDIVRKDEEILHCLEDFYTELYNKQENCNQAVEQEFWESLTKVALPVNIANECNKPFSICEINKAVFAMKNKKTPGNDGIPIDVYKVFWKRLAPLFLNVVNYCYQEGCLFPSGAEGILNLIPKQEKDTRYIKNLRPITLLNADYKIIEKLMATRIEKGFQFYNT